MVTRAVVALAVLVAALPVVSAAIAHRRGWVPASDWAVPVVFGWDTLGGHPRTIGQWSSLSRFAKTDVFQPGPLQFWLLAIPERIFAPSPAGALYGSALVSTAAVVVLLVVAWRRGGVRTLAAITLITALLLRGLGAELLRDPYNPAIAVMALIAFLAAAWAVVDDDPWFWPVAVFFGSVSAQAHVTLLAPLGTVGLVMVVASVRRRRRTTSASWRVWAATVVVAGLCWAGPVANQFFGSGNLGNLISAGSSNDAHAAGLVSGLRRMLSQLSIFPSWLTKAFRPGLDHQHPASLWALASGIAVALLVVVGIWRALGRRDTSLAALGAVSVAATIGGVISSARLPIEGWASQASTNRFFWWPIGALLWMVVGSSVVDLVGAVTKERVRPSASRHGEVALAGVALVVVLVAGSLLVANASPAHDPVSSSYGEVQTFATASAPLCRKGEVVAVDGDTAARASAVGGLVAMLSLAGCIVHTSNGNYFGYWREIDGREPVTLFLSDLAKPMSGFRRIASYDGTKPTGRYRGFDNVGILMTRRVVHLDVRGSLGVPRGR